MNDKQNNGAGSRALPLILIVVGVLVVAGVFTWLGFRQGQPNTSSTQTPAAGSAISDTPFAEIKRVSLEEAKAAFDSQSAVFVDVRDAESYKTAHIPGALNIPLAQIESRTGELDPNKWIITYCT
jgi:3-mercaptopyruvate sulfurtransferase SseA